MRDASAKGRMHPGERNGMAKLTDEQARTIRREWTGARGEYMRVAERYGVSDTLIRLLIKGKTWRAA